MSIESLFRSFSTPPLSSGQHREKSNGTARYGFGAGYADGMREALAVFEQQSGERTDRTARQQQESLDVLRTISTALRARDEPIVRDWLAIIERNALDLAEALIGAELERASDSAASTVHDVFTQAELDLMVRVRMNPGDLAALDAERRDSLDLTLVADPSLPSGMAIADYPDDEVEHCLSRAIERTRLALRG